MNKTIAGVGLALLACCTGLHAEEVGALDTWNVAVGGYALNLDARLRVDGDLRGHEFDLSGDLGLDRNRDVGLFSLGWRPFERHQFDISHYRDELSNTRILDRQITVDDETFTIGARLDSRFDNEVYDFTYTWWLQAAPRQAFGLNVGLVGYLIDLDLRAESNASGVVIERSASASVDLPAPKIGVSYRRAFGDGWRFTASGSTFETSVGDIDARVLDARAGIEYYPFSRAGVRLQYSINRINAELDDPDFHGRARLGFSGLQLQLVGRF